MTGNVFRAPLINGKTFFNLPKVLKAPQWGTLAGEFAAGRVLEAKQLEKFFE